MLFSLCPSVLGFAGHATHFVVFWALAGVSALVYALEKNRLLLYFAAGALLALAFIMKQPGIFFLVFGAAYIIIRGATSGPSKLNRPVHQTPYNRH
jgi:4-amino-4-deoxy-L-arabinose transferase-like glycosyltransferase